MPDRWLARWLAREVPVRPGAETYRSARPDRFGCVLIHGWAGSPAEMRPIADHLIGLGIDVLTVRLAGHGTSLWDLNRYTERDWVASVDRALDEYLREKDRVVVCGFSMGGLLALRTAATRAADPRLVAVVALSAPVQFRRGPEARRAALRGLWQRVRTGRPHSFKPDAADALVSYDVVGPRALLHLTRLMADTVPLLPRVHQPILIVQSLNDRTVPAFNAEIVYRRVTSCEKHLTWVTESGHLLTVDYEADTVTEEVGEFVRRIRDRETSAGLSVAQAEHDPVQAEPGAAAQDPAVEIRSSAR